MCRVLGDSNSGPGWKVQTNPLIYAGPPPFFVIILEQKLVVGYLEPNIICKIRKH